MYTSTLVRKEKGRLTKGLQFRKQVSGVAVI